MLFNSFPFLFLFLPVAFLGAFVLFRAGRNGAAIAYLVVCSLFFYAYWNPAHLWVIVASVLANHWLGGRLAEAADETRRRLWLALGLAGNLGALGYYKYLGFFSALFGAGTMDDFFGTIVSKALPIGISFYTFQQIAFLVDCHRTRRRFPYPLPGYAFFIAFFPQLIAGPIVRHDEIMPQLGELGRRLRGPRYAAQWLAPGVALLAIGLVKKVLVADSLAGFADDAFRHANVPEITFFDAWGGALAYTLQIYFDFSGYSDMALGMGLMFGLRLPVNFAAPYRAASIIDFWRRWHMTLSRFLRDYLYVPLGGNRRGTLRRYVNLLATMLIGGFWHGANWTFVVWGGLHGLMLAANHGLRRLVPWRPPAWLAVPVTFLFVLLAWVPFRAESLLDALRFWKVMAGAEGIVVPWTYGGAVAALGPLAETFGVRAGEVIHFGGLRQAAACAAGLAIVLFGPNSMLLLEPRHRRTAMASRLVPAGLGVALAASLVLMAVRSNAVFLYFQF
jgi:alginate O-acetyltransferase complex protein AlgI